MLFQKLALSDFTPGVIVSLATCQRIRPPPFLSSSTFSEPGCGLNNLNYQITVLGIVQRGNIKKCTTQTTAWWASQFCQFARRFWAARASIMLWPANHADSCQIMSSSKCLSLEVSTYFHMQTKSRVSFSWSLQKSRKDSRLHDSRKTVCRWCKTLSGYQHLQKLQSSFHQHVSVKFSKGRSNPLLGETSPSGPKPHTVLTLSLKLSGSL